MLTTTYADKKTAHGYLTAYYNIGSLLIAFWKLVNHNKIISWGGRDEAIIQPTCVNARIEIEAVGKY